MAKRDSVKCPYCGKRAEMVAGSKIYPDVKSLWNRLYYLCEPCEAYVGTHIGSVVPLGTLANKELRIARVQAHSAIDPLWKSKRMTRSGVYGWLAAEMQVCMCHIGLFDVAQCKQVIAIVNKLEGLIDQVDKLEEVT